MLLLCTDLKRLSVAIALLCLHESEREAHLPLFRFILLFSFDCILFFFFIFQGDTKQTKIPATNRQNGKKKEMIAK